METAVQGAPAKPAEVPKTAVAKPEPKREGPRLSAGARRAFSFLSIGVGALGGLRYFEHREPSTGEVRTYKAKGFSGILLALELRPPKIELFGWRVSGEFWHSNALSSYSQRKKGIVESPSSRMNLLVEGLMRFGRHPKAPIIGAGLGLGVWTYDFDLPDEPDLERPVANYTFARAQGSVRLPFHPVTLIGEGGLLYVFLAEDLGNRSVRGSPIGTEYSLCISFALPRKLEIRVRGIYTYFLGELNPVPRDNPLTASIRDEYLTLNWTVHLNF